MDFYHSLGSLKSAELAFKLAKPIDFVFMTLKILEQIITWGESDEKDNIAMPYLYVDSKRLHRAFIVKNNQIVSFSFPFAVYTKKGSRQVCINYRSIKLDATLISEATSIANEYKKANSFAEVANSLDLADHQVKDAVTVFETILSLEPSYMRYDYDQKSSNGQMHPMYHIDVNFTKDSSYKIGLYAPASMPKIVSILSQSSRCFYLEQYMAKWYSKIRRKVKRYVHRRMKRL